MSPTRVSLKHVSRFRDRHGHLRHYLRIPGCKKLSLPGEPGSPEFMAAYAAGIAQAPQAAPKVKGPPPGTLDALAVAYYSHGSFTGLRESSQANYRRIVEQLRAKHGDKPIRMLDAAGVRVLMAEKGEHRAAANHRLRVLRSLCGVAIEAGLIAADPTAGVKRLRRETKGYTSWSEDEIALYEKRWPSGTRERLALALLLYTAQRRSDVVRMGRQHIHGAFIAVRQVKTRAEIEVPIHPALAAELAHVPAGQMLFLQTAQGVGFTANGFYMRFRAWCDAAGIPAGRSPHGLRKACARRLAEAGATTHQIGAVTGHKTLSEIEVYTRAAEQKRLASAGMKRIQLPTPRRRISNP
ncbi:tyrosine-type recombinase/integrase [Sediminicoccus sp. KRV36]|uniref:tyrosine-type recombinase/integrase n=1 Tax=Sediminicoccus sp. KRV36 TaxID=3133721 RepID=UPI00200E6589|nr:tyrosine-type recombinase/integrase [Sediminicoccus rosea]UPY35533.1 tyrosine-type recombinase/integrase [Sediminicoccus rosea]